MKTKLKPEAIEILHKIQDKIRKSPTSFDMNIVVEKEVRGTILATILLKDNLLPACGTTACIAGWTLILSGKPIGPAALASAAEILGIPGGTTGVGSELFLAGCWPEPFRSRDRKLSHELHELAVSAWPKDDASFASRIEAVIKERGEVAIQRIDHFIEKGE